MKHARRDFLKQTCLLGAGAAALARARPASGQEAGPTPKAKPMPMVPFGPHKISRLVLGSNPVRAVTHTAPMEMNRALREFYSAERIRELLWHCQRLGINYFQTEPHAAVIEGLRQYKEDGGKLQFMATVTSDIYRSPQPFEDLFSLSPTSANVMGENVDSAYQRGAMEPIHDILKKLHDRGLYAGLATHIPEVVEYVEERAWETDFYLLCAYNLRRTREEWQKILGPDLPVGEIYLAGDPARACAVARLVKKPCMLFKILAAGRLTRPAAREAAFRFFLQNIKPTDAVDVGMSILVGDEPGENAELMSRLLT